MLQENMRRYYRGLAAVLMCVVLSGAAGCSREPVVYIAGLESETAAEQAAEQTNVPDAAGAGVLAGLQSGQAEETSAGTQSDDMGDTAQTEGQSETADGYIYICGAVQRPGVYPIRDGMRVFEVLEQAGGFAGEADEQWLNQAETVQDGQRLYVYTEAETALLKEAGVTAADAGASGGAAGTDAQDQKVNINTADAETLMTLPGIGEAKAAAIIQYREEYGAFGSVEEIQNISGIKNAVFSQIKDRITVQ